MTQAARDRSRCEEYVLEKKLEHATVYDGYQELLDQAGDSIDAICDSVAHTLICAPHHNFDSVSREV